MGLSCVTQAETKYVFSSEIITCACTCISFTFYDRYCILFIQFGSYVLTALSTKSGVEIYNDDNIDVNVKIVYFIKLSGILASL